MSADGWFEVVEGPELHQGDILRRCPIPTILGLDRWPLPEGEALDVDVRIGDACVLTQSCDLENDKVGEVLFGQVVDWSEARTKLLEQGNTAAGSTRFLDALIAGNVPGVSLLRKFEGDPAMGWSIVDFHRLFLLPKKAAQAVATANGRRLRLVPPYRENLGQAFARYFMRVGLPLDAKEFRTEGKATTKVATEAAGGATLGQPGEPRSTET